MPEEQYQDLGVPLLPDMLSLGAPGRRTATRQSRRGSIGPAGRSWLAERATPGRFLWRVRGSSAWRCTSCDLGFLARVERAQVFLFAAVPSPAGAPASALTPHPDLGDMQANLPRLSVVGKVS
jgi:hypothetical protein